MGSFLSDLYGCHAAHGMVSGQVPETKIPISG